MCENSSWQEKSLRLCENPAANSGCFFSKQNKIFYVLVIINKRKIFVLQLNSAVVIQAVVKPD